MEDGLGGLGTVLVLGGASDIGVAIAQRLADEGTRRVILAGRDEQALHSAAAGFPADIHVATRRFDAVDTEGHQAFFDAVTDEFGDLDVVVLAFGVLPKQSEVEADAYAAVEVAQVNYVGAMSCAVLAANVLRAQGHGTLVVLSSVAAERARRSNFVYGSTKAGIDALAQGLGYALDRSGAHVVVVRPGFVRTKMTEGLDDAPMATTPEEVAAATVTAIRRHTPVVWVPAQLRFVMSGIRHLPRTVMKRITT